MLPSIRYLQRVCCQNGNGCLYLWGAYYHDCTVVRHVHVYLIWISIPFCLHGFQVDRCLLALQSLLVTVVIVVRGNTGIIGNSGKSGNIGKSGNSGIIGKSGKVW